MKVQKIEYQCKEDDVVKIGIACVQEWGTSDVEWIIDFDGNRVKELWSYKLVDGPLCYLEC